MTVKFTLKFKREQCDHCPHADKIAMRDGKAHCPFGRQVKVVNGICKTKEAI